MIDGKPVREITEHLLSYPRELLSLYVVVPADPAAQRAVSLRVAAAIGVPGGDEELARRVIAVVDAARTEGTLAIFATKEFLDLYELDAVLPVGTLASGQVEAHWGATYLAPLLLLLDRRRRYAVVCMDSRRIRVFELVLGAMHLVLERSAIDPPDLHDDLEPSKQVHPAYVASRDSAAHDRAGRHLDEWRAGFYRRVGAELRALLLERGIDSVILTGLEQHAAEFIDTAPDEIASRVVGRLPSCSRPDASPAEVLDHVRETVAEADQARDQELVTRIAEQGITGLEATLSALQLGQLSTIAAAWQLDVELRVDGVTEQFRLDRSRPSGDRLSDWSARLLLPRLAAARGTELIFLPGASGERLLREHGGLGGLTRWR